MAVHLASAALHVVYNLLMLASYQLGEFSQMYPLARGTSREWWRGCRSSCSAANCRCENSQACSRSRAGLIGLVFIGGRPGRKDLPALTAAALTGLAIASYTVIDGVGVMHAPLFAYTGWMFLLQAPPIAALAVIRRGRRLPAAVRESAVPGLVGGAISIAAYTIVLWVQTSGALAPIAALREMSIVFGALIGAVFLGERLGARRAFAAGVVLAGVVLISFP